MISSTNQSTHRSLAGWLDCRRTAAPRPRGSVEVRQPDGGLRFAFYGRISTADFQDRASSRQWQRDSATELITGRGRITAEYFDVGCSRSLRWADRPQAANLLDAVANPDRGFDAIVIGEYERAFATDQLIQLLPMLERHQVQLWLPETDGPIDLHQPIHRALIMLLGHQSKREVLRARFRTTAAMLVQARDQGRHLGGRPPYGYRLVDAGPHPNRAHARWGRRLHRLDPDPATAPHVRWMFAQRLAGSSVAGIARALNERGIPCPSSADPERNRHRTGDGWTLRTVAAILANPRYTGRQVWNRQGINRDRDAVRHGAPPTRRWNPTEQWAVSTKASHPALVSEEDFVAAQAISALATPSDGGIRSYQLVGRMRCGECGRRLHSHWVNDRPGYRCRHGHTSAKTSTANRAPILYVREDHALAKIAALLPEDAAVLPAHVADYLRDHNLMIACAPGTYAIETDPSLAIPPADRLRPPQSLRNAARNDPTQLVSKT